MRSRIMMARMTNSSEEIIARFIAQAFPAANLKIEGEGEQVVYEILLNEKMLVRLDRIRAVFNFPTRGSGKMSWSGIKEGSPETVAASIVQDLANAGFTVLSPEGKRIQKRPVFIGRYTFCPQCNEHSLIRRIVYGMISQEYVGEDKDKKCFMVCECGWKIEIESFRHPWSLIETRVRMRKHMEELGLTTGE